MPYAYGDNFWEPVLVGAARTAATNSPHMVNQCYPGFVLCVEITVNAGEAAIITPQVMLLYPYTNTWFGIWTANVALTAVGLYCYQLYPTVAAIVCATYTQECRMMIPRDWRLSVGHANANPITYQAGVCYVKG